MTDEKKIATFVKQRNGIGDGRVYRVEPPIKSQGQEHDYVWVSAIHDPYAHETYILPCDADGEVADGAWELDGAWGIDGDWGLDGSYHGGTDHAEALRRGGYEVA